ncbi:MAG: hypothetical protein R3C56_34005 [Pirellulaceae bacterium]
MTDGEHEAAADELEELLKEHPEQHPLAYLAASQAAMAGDSARLETIATSGCGRLEQ